MAHRGARIRSIELAVHDSVECHGASSGAKRGDENQAEFLPARPPMGVPRGDDHRRQSKRQGEYRVRDFDKLCPFANFEQHCRAFLNHSVIGRATSCLVLS